MVRCVSPDNNNGTQTGQSVTIGSRFVPAAVANDPAARANASIAITTVAAYVPVLGHLVMGGAVAAYDPSSTETSVTPARRTGLVHLCHAISWDFQNNTAAVVDPVFGGIFNLTEVYRNAWPNSGAYWSESDFLEPQWQQSFWGINYPRLQTIKAAVDPQGVFDCYHCVELP